MKVIGIIQARYNSTRLPGKVCKEINGLPLLWHIYRRMLACKELDQVVVAMGDGDGWERIMDTCSDHAMLFTLGDETDLISRIRKASQEYRADAFVRVTADCIWTGPEFIDAIVGDYKNLYPIHRGFASWPDRHVSEGLDMEIMSTELLAQLDRDKDCPREDFMTYAIKNKLIDPWPSCAGRIMGYSCQDLHLSIDTQEDFDQAEKMMKYMADYEFSYSDTLRAYNHVHAGK